METLRVNIQNEQEKKVLLAFLDSLGYQYLKDSDEYVMNDTQIKEMLQRKIGYEAGTTTARPWSDIKKRYKSI